MPIIVDREEKTAYICQKAYEEFVKNGIENISLNQIIFNMGISKGQFYHYFKTKEELIFAVISHKTQEAFIEYGALLESLNTLEENLFTLYALYLSNEQFAKDYRRLLFDTFHLFTHSQDTKIKEYNTEYYQWIENKLLEIFNKCDIKEENSFIKSINATADGMYLRSLADNSFDLQSNLHEYLQYIINKYKG